MDKNLSEIVTKIDLREENSFDNYKLLYNDFEKKYYIFRKLDKSEILTSLIGNNEDVIYNSMVEFEGEMFESICFDKELNEELIWYIYEFIVEKKWKLLKMINEIRKMTKIRFEKADLQKIRGLYAEIYACLEYNLSPKEHENSIYDLSDGEVDYEVKSYSKVKRTFKIKYQQLTNNDKAKIILVELMESSEGESLKEIYNKLPVNFRNRFNFVNKLSNVYKDMKFKVGKKEVREISDFRENLSMPLGCVDATFEFSVK